VKIMDSWLILFYFQFVLITVRYYPTYGYSEDQTVDSFVVFGVL